MKLGIVGLPNVGKSTLFNAITNAGVPADNYAFCTIDPNVGVVSVPDERLAWLAELHQPKKVTSRKENRAPVGGQHVFSGKCLCCVRCFLKFCPLGTHHLIVISYYIIKL